MDLYALFRRGVYRHECGGIFTTKELAKKAISELEQQEPDDYHSWVCVPFTADQPVTTNLNTDWYEFEVHEPDAIEL